MKPKLKLIPALFFGLWCFVWIVSEASAVWIHSVFPLKGFGTYWIIMMLCMFGAEIRGVISKGRGDTLSELIWAFLGKEPGKAGLGVGIALALSLRVVSLPFLFIGYHQHFLFVFGPWIALCAGLGAWLAIHFPTRGSWRDSHGA